MKRFISALAILVLLCIMPVTALAETKGSSLTDSLATKPSQAVQQALEVINSRIEVPVSVLREQPLHNTYLEVIATLYHLSPMGYMIFDPVRNEILEYSTSHDHQFMTDDSAAYIYGGALQYFEKEGSFLTNLKSGASISLSVINQENDLPRGSDYIYAPTPESVDKDQILRNAEDNEFQDIQTSSLTQNQSLSTEEIGNFSGDDSLSLYANQDCYWYYYSDELTLSTRFYNCNVTKNMAYFGYPEAGENDGVCGTVSVAILMAYYDDYRDDCYVPNNLDKTFGAYNENTYGCKLTKNLIPYIDGNTPGVTFLNGGIDGGPGIDAYLDDVGVDNETRWNLILDNKGVIRYGASHNRPTIVGTAGLFGSTYGDHFTVAIGYYEYGYMYSDGNIYSNTFFIHINNGWGYDDYINVSTIASTWWLYYYA